MTADWDSLEEARRRLPVGGRVRGRVRLIPRPGTIGIFIDLGQATEGFVDVLTLPVDPARWPQVGTFVDFEILQHRPGQVRLWPLEPRWRRDAPSRLDDETWGRVRSHYYEGQIVCAQTTEVFRSNREYVVAFNSEYAVLEWLHELPTVGEIREYRVMQLLDTTHRILLLRA